MSERAWRFYLDDMVLFCERVLSYTQDMDQPSFLASGLTYDASLRNIELLGEAATHIPDHVRTNHPNIPWRMVVATRNRLIHGYLGIDNDTVWSLISEHFPRLLSDLQALQKLYPLEPKNG